MVDQPNPKLISRRSALAALAWSPLAMSSVAAAPVKTGAGFSDRVCLPDGRWLSYASFGNPSGPLVLYFHGTPGARIEAELIHEEALARGVRLVAVERPGIGRSTYQSGRKILKWPADVANFVSLLGYGESPFGIVAVSGGAPYALACEVCMPHRLTHVAVVAGHTPLDAPVVPGNQDARIRRFTRRPRLGNIVSRIGIRMLHRRPESFTNRVGDSWSASDRQLILCNPELKAKFLANMREAVRCGNGGVLTDVRLLGSYWGYQLCNVPVVSTSFWQGGCDRIATPSMGEYFHRCLPHSEYHFDPRAGHVTILKWHAHEIMARFPA
jgi:pimeloyl-ACP methyl ester carboxylesterase